MNSRLKNLLEEYAGLERGVQELVSAQCGPVCGLCTVACCCRADICEEALESPFLRLLHKQDTLDSDRYGFLTETGCALPAGRPPICYEFFCEELLNSLPDEKCRELLKILGRLPTHAGQNALGDAHLVEIMQKAELEHLAFQRLEKQLQESFQCLEILRRFFNKETLPEDAGRVLNRITLNELD
ncbi:MAG: hypothetical protein WC047_02870 [Kiritimatiellales bacterium]